MPVSSEGREPEREVSVTAHLMARHIGRVEEPVARAGGRAVVFRGEARQFVRQRGGLHPIRAERAQMVEGGVFDREPEAQIWQGEERHQPQGFEQCVTLLPVVRQVAEEQQDARHGQHQLPRAVRIERQALANRTAQ